MSAPDGSVLDEPSFDERVAEKRSMSSMWSAAEIIGMFVTMRWEDDADPERIVLWVKAWATVALEKMAAP